MIEVDIENEAVINAAWANGRIVPGVDPAVRRKDVCGAWIVRDQYGVMEENGAGWLIDCISVNQGAGGGAEDPQPMQWENLQAKIRFVHDGEGENHGRWFCVREARLL